MPVICVMTLTEPGFHTGIKPRLLFDTGCLIFINGCRVSYMAPEGIYLTLTILSPVVLALHYPHPSLPLTLRVRTIGVWLLEVLLSSLGPLRTRTATA